MSSLHDRLPQVYLARHGETAWSLSGQHTGLTDVPLTDRGERNARRLGERLTGLDFSRVFTSPLQRASRTCELAGFGEQASRDRDLVEWNYGSYEGQTTNEIHQARPDWEIFRDGCPDGESVTDVATRANRIIERLRSGTGDTLVFSSSHFLRVFVACWLGIDPIFGKYFSLGTAALSIVGYNRSLHDPVVLLWNDCSHNEENAGSS